MAAPHKINCVSYNCRGVKLTDQYEIKSMLQKFDISCFQETWLTTQECQDINNLVPGYRGIANSPNDDKTMLTIGRKNKKEGVAIMWNANLDRYVSPVPFEFNWVVGVKVTVQNKTMYVINVYLPYECEENKEEFIDRLSKLNVLQEELDSTCVSIIGDFNSNVLKPGSHHAKYLSEYCELFNYKWSSKILLPDDTFTYISEAWGSHSWLDHCISSEDGHNMIENMYVLYENIMSDHIPFAFTVNIECAPEVVQCPKETFRSKLDWGKVNEVVRQNTPMRVKLC